MKTNREQDRINFARELGMNNYKKNHQLKRDWANDPYDSSSDEEMDRRDEENVDRMIKDKKYRDSKPPTYHDDDIDADIEYWDNTKNKNNERKMNNLKTFEEWRFLGKKELTPDEEYQKQKRKAQKERPSSNKENELPEIDPIPQRTRQDRGLTPARKMKDIDDSGLIPAKKYGDRDLYGEENWEN